MALSNEELLSDSQFRALEILISTNIERTFSARAFAEKMWPQSNMHTKTSNTGNGATRGKAAWLCGGSYLRKLEKKK